MALNPGGLRGQERRPFHRRTHSRITRAFWILAGVRRHRESQWFGSFVHAERGDATTGEVGRPQQPTV